MQIQTSHFGDRVGGFAKCSALTGIDAFIWSEEGNGHLLDTKKNASAGPFSVDFAVATFRAKDPDLLPVRMNPPFLFGRAASPRSVERGGVAVAAPLHLGDQALVPKIQGPQAAAPARGFRVIPVSLFSFRQDGPDSVKLPMFAEKVLAA